jgi:hypothetical protein
MDFYANVIINWRTALSQLSAVSSTHNLSTCLVIIIISLGEFSKTFPKY